MHGHGFYHHHHWGRGWGHGFHRGPSRLLWFALGAGTATMFIWHKEAHMQAHARHWGHCVRAPIQVPGQLPAPPNSQGSASEVMHADVPLPSSETSAASYPPSRPGERWGASWGWHGHKSWTFPSAEEQEKQWKEEKEKFMIVGQKAQDAMVEVSESTLDSILGNLEAMKVKLAEYRAEREKQQEQEKKVLQEHIEAQEQAKKSSSGTQRRWF